ncbi:chemotaxis protein CheW [Pseudolabrys sp. Root1462]|jgi:purine-binding chemotaxis protein CheW|uniref:chemotaxis protein CheW n=1 Tax=Pseudolabrys sp. Root1462 TaxID=1736466 RepID=UPI000703C0D8|nr:chemotaxis protein CheW [Pseudolabrys sp. Root1462]KQZ01980.1 chemotaxis protein CheW [Pseudolabrys sp. Root1462]
MNTDSEQVFNEYVTAMVGGQLFGLPIRRVQDVFLPDRLTKVPLASPEIGGLINLRGRIVTLVDLAYRLGLSRRSETSMAIGVELAGESYGLLIDSVGEVMNLDAAALERNPINLDPRLAAVSSGIYRLEEQLLLVLDVDRVLAIDTSAAAA